LKCGHRFPRRPTVLASNPLFMRWGRPPSLPLADHHCGMTIGTPYSWCSLAQLPTWSISPWVSTTRRSSRRDTLPSESCAQSWPRSLETGIDEHESVERGAGGARDLDQVRVNSPSLMTLVFPSHGYKNRPSLRCLSIDRCDGFLPDTLPSKPLYSQAHKW